jgi:hypothetical protein
LIRDAHGVIDNLRRSESGKLQFRRKPQRALFAEYERLSENTEVEATITLTTNAEAGRLVTAPSPRAITVQRTAFVCRTAGQ